jgi:hypothetical protein
LILEATGHDELEQGVAQMKENLAHVSTGPPA